MPYFIVKVAYKLEKAIRTWAQSEEEAEEKACAIVDKWNGVIETEALDTQEE